MSVSSTDTTTVKIGQRVYSALYGGRYGTIIAIHGEQSPESIHGVAFMASGGNAHFDVAFDEGAISKGLPEAIVRGVQWRILDEVVDTDSVIAAWERSKQFEADKHVEKLETEARRARERVDHAAAYPYLTTVENMPPKWSRARLVAANIRTELKRAFPKVKFSVRADGYSSIDINWSQGPKADDVSAIVKKYEGGSFDGMTDCYNYDPDNTFSDVFGEVRYVFTKRQFDDATEEMVALFICAQYGVDYEGYNTRIGYEYVSSMVNKLLASKTVPPGMKVSGIVRNDRPSSEYPWVDWYDLEFVRLGDVKEVK